MTRVRSPWPEDDESTLEIKKLMAEIAKLEIEHQKLLKDNLRRWRLAGVIGPILTAIIALGGIYLAYQQVVYQGQTIKQQSETIKAQAIDRAKEARSRLLQQALSMATDPSGGPDRRISGIYQLREFWSGNSEEARIVAATLAALVTIPDSPGAASIRCAAVDAISAIFDVPNGVAIDVPRLLFGDARTQKQGLISYQNNLLLLREEARAYPERRNYFDVYNFEFRANQGCTTSLASTREAITKSWPDLQNVNLANADLDGAALYRANLHGADLKSAAASHTNFQCANLTNANLFDMRLREEFDWQFWLAAYTPADPAHPETRSIFGIESSKPWKPPLAPAGAPPPPTKPPPMVVFADDEMQRRGAIPITNEQWVQWSTGPDKFSGPKLIKILGGVPNYLKPYEEDLRRNTQLCWEIPPLPIPPPRAKNL